MKTEIVTIYKKFNSFAGLRTHSGEDAVILYKRNGKIDKVFAVRVRGYDGEFEIRELTASQFELEYSFEYIG